VALALERVHLAEVQLDQPQRHVHHGIVLASGAQEVAMRRAWTPL
jgi:hypothetical protein